MVGKALVLAMLLLANKSGTLTNQTGLRGERLDIYQEAQMEEMFPEGIYEENIPVGDGMSSQAIYTPESNPSTDATIEQKREKRENDTAYPRKAYTQDKDGSWVCNNRYYKFRYELIGRNEGATEDGRFLVLTNDANISFSKVSKSFTSTDPADALDIKDTVVVEAGWYR